jgi:DNA-binding NtrC family response regulator
MPDDRLRLAIVEDQPRLRAQLRASAQDLGFAVADFGDAESALQAISAGAADAVLTDFHLPGLNGIDLLTRVRAFDAALPVVLMTAYPTVELAQQALRDGALDLLVKPFQLGELDAALARAAERALAIRRAKTQLSLIETDTEADASSDDPDSLRTLAEVEDAHIRRTLRAVQGNVTRAAKVLGVSRRTLYNRLGTAGGPGSGS